jgi:hypothetical protein
VYYFRQGCATLKFQALHKRGIAASIDWREKHWLTLGGKTRLGGPWEGKVESVQLVAKDLSCRSAEKGAIGRIRCQTRAHADRRKSNQAIRAGQTEFSRL